MILLSFVLSYVSSLTINVQGTCTTKYSYRLQDSKWCRAQGAIQDPLLRHPILLQYLWLRAAPLYLRRCVGRACIARRFWACGSFDVLGLGRRRLTSTTWPPWTRGMPCPVTRQMWTISHLLFNFISSDYQVTRQTLPWSPASEMCSSASSGSILLTAMCCDAKDKIVNREIVCHMSIAYLGLCSIRILLQAFSKISMQI